MFNMLAWSLGTPELIVILAIALLLFGRRLPEIARGLGKSLMEFKKGIKESQDDIHKAIDESDMNTEKQTPQEKKPS